MAEPAEALRKSWLQMLAHERRASPHTLRAYGDDVSTFLGFQAGHVGGAMTDKLAELFHEKALPPTLAKTTAGKRERAAARRLH